MKTINSKTVLFVTGAFVSNSGWDEWKTYFENKGYKTLAPAWPFKEGTAKELRDRQPNDTQLAALTLPELIDHYANIAKQLPEKPIIIGHSLGGLITQILINRGLGVAGVAIHPVPPKGVIPYEFSFLKAGYKVLGIFSSLKKTYLMSLKDWQYAFTNGMTLQEQIDTYEKNTIPESKTVGRGGLSSAAKVDFNKPHVPLLITSGDKDNIIPASMNLRNFKKYSQTNGSVTEYKEFVGRNHFVLGIPTWKEDADYILDWLNKH
jgi:pimeloyl-ACP methyl ester carboxylesterase